MTKALGVIIFQGAPIRHEWYRLTFDLLKKTLAKVNDQVDKIYLVCNSYNPTVEDLDFLRTLGHGKVTIQLEQMASHWQCMNMLCKQVVEDQLLLIDSDTLIYDPWVITKNFKELDDADVVSIFDSSGEDLGYGIMEDQRRFAPYFCFLDMLMLRGTSMNFDPDTTHDSMGLLTKELLDYDAIARRLPDDRGTVYIDGTVYPAITPTPGYYHLRNWNGALHILTSYINDKVSYTRDVTLMPINERCRLLAWVAIINDICNKDAEIDLAVENIFKDWGINNWREYIQQFRSFHSWTENL